MILLDNVSKAFGKKSILEGMCLEIEAGESFVIIGRSGIGKSVTLRHIVGLLQPDHGRVEVFGQDLSKLDRDQTREHRKRIGYLFQDGALLNWLTLEENVALPLREHGYGNLREIRERVAEVLAVVELGQHGHKYPTEISGGMRKRAGLARALVTKPDIVLYDEPTSGLDPISSSIINHLVRDLQQRYRVAQVIVTHDMNSAYYIADRIGLLHGGNLCVIGTPDEIRQSESAAVQQFIHGNISGPLSHSTDAEAAPSATVATATDVRNPHG